MGTHFNILSSLEKEALKDYAAEKYFTESAQTRGDVNAWVNTFANNMAKNERGKILDVTRAYVKERRAAL